MDISDRACGSDQCIFLTSQKAAREEVNTEEPEKEENLEKKTEALTQELREAQRGLY